MSENPWREPGRRRRGALAGLVAGAALALTILAGTAAAGAEEPRQTTRGTERERRGVGEPVAPDPTTRTNPTGNPANGAPRTNEGNAPASTTPATPIASRDEVPTGIALAAGIGAGVLVGLLVGALVGALMGRRARPAPAAEAAPVAPVAPAGARGDPDTTRQRADLVSALIAIRDQLGSDVLRSQAGEALQRAGISEVRPDGHRFDPQWHQAVDQVLTTDQTLDGTIAATERPGYVEGTRVIRLPEVVVYRLGG